MKKIGIIPTMIFIGVLIGLVSTLNINQISGENHFTFLSEDSFNILILPLTPDKECNYKSTNYENQVIERLNTLAVNNRLAIKTHYHQIDTCVYTWKEAEEIRKNTNSNMIIWGSYEEDCTTDDKVRIRFVCNEYNDAKTTIEGDTEMQPIQNLFQLRQGKLLKNLEQIAILTLSFAKESSEEIITMLEEHFEPCSDGYSKIGEVHMIAKNYQQAKKFYQELLDCEEKDLRQKSIYNTGLCLFWQDSLEQAKDKFKTYLKTDSITAQGYIGMARVLKAQQKYDDAIYFFQRTIDIENKTYLDDKQPMLHRGAISESFNSIANCYAKMDSFEKEHKYLKFGVGIWPKDASINHNLARTYERKRMYEKALEHYSIASEIDSTINEPLYGSAVILRKLERYDESIKLMKDLILKEPKSIEYKKEIQISLCLAGKAEEALSYLYTLMNSNIGNINLILDMAYQYDSVNEFKVSHGLMYEVISIQPNNEKAREYFRQSAIRK